MRLLSMLRVLGPHPLPAQPHRLTTKAQPQNQNQDGREQLWHNTAERQDVPCPWGEGMCAHKVWAWERAGRKHKGEELCHLS